METASLECGDRVPSGRPLSVWSLGRAYEYITPAFCSLPMKSGDKSPHSKLIIALLSLLLLAAPAFAKDPDFPGAVLFNSNPPFLAGVKVNHADLVYHEGDRLIIEFTAERESYLYLIYHQADGTSYLLFPNEARTDNRIAAQKSIRIPAADEEFRFRVRPPFGTEVLQVLSTLKPAPELDKLVAKTGRAAPVSRDVIGQLHARLKADLPSWSEHRVPIRTEAAAAPPPDRKANRVGLFIAANKSEKTKESTDRFLLGCELVAKTMAQRGGIRPNNMKMLTNEQATRANIESAITQWLPSVSQPGDTVFIFYAGHGGVTRNPGRPDLRDGFVTTYDDDLGPGRMTEEEWEARCRAKFVTDTALARWLQELPGRQIVLLLSTCHAGGMVDTKTLSKFGVRQAALVKGISQVNVAVLCTAAPDELTLSPSNKYPVFLAQYLAEAMTNLPRPVTLRQAYDYYHEEMRKNLVNRREVGAHEPVLTDTALLPIVLAP